MLTKLIGNNTAKEVFITSSPFLLSLSNSQIPQEECRLSLEESDGFFCEYDQDWSRRKSLHYSQNEKNHVSNKRSSFFLDNWEPTIHCTFEQRLGISHGGKWACDIYKLQTNNSQIPLIYSFGSNGDFSFEEAVKDILPNSEIHTFDKDLYTCPNEICTFHQAILGNGKKKGSKPLKRIINELHHHKRRIDILKVDIEGSEFDLFDDLFDSTKSTAESTNLPSSQSMPYIHQIFVEIHLPWNSGDEESLRAHNFFELFRHNNYAIFHKEANLVDCRSVFEDSRFSDETNTYYQLAVSILSSSESFTVKEVREADDILFIKGNEKLIGTFKGTLQEKHVLVNCAEIPITIYTPIDVNKDKLVIFFHGGGWVSCNCNTHQTIVNTLADATKTIWISVQYRLAPEHKYPIWLDDSCDVTRYIVENKVSYGVHQTAKIGVAGDSVGAQISASICHMVKNIDFQILVYGFFDVACRTPSHKEFSDPMYILTPALLEWFKLNAFRDAKDLTDHRVAVLLNKSFDTLPPCLFIVAELDPLRDDSYVYQKLLDKAGVKTEFLLVKGVLHDFLAFPGIYLNACTQAINAIQQFMSAL
ncbi:unnamed protein product [Rotaria socialis]|uniref:Alpha/beta hydrolase fold-3 domain-containing protein n=1 Tax=Rotaria socialis TaxID=392032 RepID=A0A818ENM1_9BILA|nr:unnamed protein product [Rotaria socialis]CAF4398077.1 unnamed protein product [Rotaria socialis]CAF4428732.1 unnamed protein product [Rotaria socialis]